eukprot:GHVT01000429.1.p1 GENE.GHVT01000429.1~~GHVT01000429.1.p1  ORF type:complete len:349 (-),score=8.31 GHVT01000429.1:402-1448(-)
MLIPVCDVPDKETECTQSKILLYTGKKWVIFFDKFQDSSNNIQWGFVHPDSTGPKLHGAGLPVTIRMGDYNMDGFPDALVILQQTSQGQREQKAFLLKNVECFGAECSPGGRTFSPVWDTEMTHLDLAVMATFFDLHEDGILDVIVISMATSGPTSDDLIPHLHTYKNSFDEDAVFVKVTVTSGICTPPSCKKPFSYGVNVPGPVISYDTTKYDGALMKSCATQLSQSAHHALQLPYTIFGLGQTANFLDTLKVGIPRSPGTDVRSSEWTAIIPNSQMIVIPHPQDNPSRWTKRLFVTPSRGVLLTGAALTGTCGFMAAIVGILHWREKREDEKEKRQEAHRFHFDAM